MTHPFPHEPIVGFFGAIASSFLLWISDAVSNSLPIPNGVVELGGTVGLIGCLTYGCVTLWKQLQIEKRDSAMERERHQKESAQLHMEILGETRRQNDKLICVLEKIDPDHRKP